MSNGNGNSSSRSKGRNRKKYTLVLHEYIGYGSYIIIFKRISGRPSTTTYPNLHFVIPGWPKIQSTDGALYFDGQK